MLQHALLVGALNAVRATLMLLGALVGLHELDNEAMELGLDDLGEQEQAYFGCRGPLRLSDRLTRTHRLRRVPGVDRAVDVLLYGTDVDFIRETRMSKEAFEGLGEAMYGPGWHATMELSGQYYRHIVSGDTPPFSGSMGSSQSSSGSRRRGRPSIHPKRRLFVLLHALAYNFTTCEALGATFNMGRTTIESLFAKDLRNLVIALREEIAWPDPLAIVRDIHLLQPEWDRRLEMARVVQNDPVTVAYEDRLRRSLFAADGVPIRLRKLPSGDNSSDYYNHKGFYSVNFMVILNILTEEVVDIHGPHPGCSSDSRMFRRMNVHNDPETYLLCDQGMGANILTDKAFPAALPYIVRPRPGVVHDADIQTCMRNPIERKFGIVKNRFKIIHTGLPFEDMHRCSLIVHACFLLDGFIRRFHTE